MPYDTAFQVFMVQVQIEKTTYLRVDYVLRYCLIPFFPRCSYLNRV